MEYSLAAPRQHQSAVMASAKELSNVIQRVLHNPAPVVLKHAVLAACGELALLRKRAAILSAKAQKYAMRIVRAARLMDTLGYKPAMHSAPVSIPAQQHNAAVITW